ncbi:hypothetical protein LTR50_004214 [Elasticomyces elasticus]|nr:hypothetical protein LTR50_004214 [Elasticomyces elasticus]
MQLKNLLPVALAAAASAQSITDALAANNATLSTLTTLLGSQPAIVAALSSASNITILAPSNAAFAKAMNSTAGMAAAAAAMPDVIAALLQYHVINGTYPASAFTRTPAFVPTLLQNSSYTNVTGGQRVEGYVNGSSVVIVSGALAKSMVVTPDVKFNGGVIHVIDTVLNFPISDSKTAAAAGLTSLASALTSAKLVDTVDNLRDVTIFAPSNNAFGAIGSALPNLTTSQLTSILTYHVVQGTVGYSSLLRNTTLKTVNGGNVSITVEGGNVFVNSARVIIPDVLVSNGVVHVIDNVLNPNNTAVSVVPTATAPATVAYSGASSASATFSGAMTTQAASSGSGMASASRAAAAPAIATGAIGMGALFGGAAVLMANS